MTHTHYTQIAKLLLAHRECLRPRPRALVAHHENGLISLMCMKLTQQGFEQAIRGRSVRSLSLGPYDASSSFIRTLAGLVPELGSSNHSTQASPPWTQSGSSALRSNIMVHSCCITRKNFPPGSAFRARSIWPSLW